MSLTRIAMTTGKVPQIRIMFLSLLALIIITTPIALGNNLPGDMSVLQAAMSLRNPALTQVIAILTFIGSAIPTLITCTGLSVVEWRRITASQPHSVTRITVSQPRILWSSVWPLIAYGGAIMTNILMRVLIGRLPPQVESISSLLPEIQADFQRFSYPSGHAMTVAVAYGAMAITIRRQSILGRVSFIFATFIIFAVGFGRLYLGVHWPSDVLGGYIIALVWLLTASIVTRQGFCAKVV